MNRLSLPKRAQIIQLLCEGNSLRSCSRIADVSFNTVLKLSVDVGRACLKFHSQTVVQIRSERVQADENYSFVYSKPKNTDPDDEERGDIWTWIAMDADTKLVISFYAGRRDLDSAKFFMNDLWCRLRTRVQLTTDGFSAYREAVDDSFGAKIDFGQLVKQYSKESTNEKGKKDKRERYTGAEKRVIIGNPDKKHLHTSYIERQNLTMRMSNRRFTRDVNAFSKKLENHRLSIAFYFVFYNFVRIHKSLKITPAMASKLTKKPMTFEDMANLTEIYK